MRKRLYDLVLLWHAQVGDQLAPEATLDRAWYAQKDSVSFEDILRTLRYATWQERIFSDPALDAHTRKILQPFVEWAKGLANAPVFSQRYVCARKRAPCARFDLGP
ncbi:hypothetical protein SBA3_1820012 [Candidatus Sulfopaludibacter sp. SbA3]|nr:hypothetical protein SBA3_1820012 [Candidatus Sulfopaludibacter sp. SbA3]